MSSLALIRLQTKFLILIVGSRGTAYREVLVSEAEPLSGRLWTQMAIRE